MHEYDRWSATTRRLPVSLLLERGDARARAGVRDHAGQDRSRSGLAGSSKPRRSCVELFRRSVFFGEALDLPGDGRLWNMRPDRPDALDFCLRWQEFGRALQQREGASYFDADGAIGVGPVVTPRLTPVGEPLRGCVATLEIARQNGVAASEVDLLDKQLRRALRSGFASSFIPVRATCSRIRRASKARCPEANRLGAPDRIHAARGKRDGPLARVEPALSFNHPQVPAHRQEAGCSARADAAPLQTVPPDTAGSPAFAGHRWRLANALAWQRTRRRNKAPAGRVDEAAPGARRQAAAASVVGDLAVVGLADGLSHWRRTGAQSCARCMAGQIAARSALCPATLTAVQGPVAPHSQHASPLRSRQSTSLAHWRIRDLRCRRRAVGADALGSDVMVAEVAHRGRGFARGRWPCGERRWTSR